ncbi:MAG: outer membrane protein assembly factor BamD [Candidatus Eisenbacteria bacterium]|uniref:Outer membrane protein assembly factor BamD n=1 Tax=Eiseniibacteriota bacterium TaxID=2212470 RepID=A0A538T3J4_UNCEI|nr:MAG: outer membrane protein assembly factor BamD [Candidatus Eisenbacteria bacterium]
MKGRIALILVVCAAWGCGGSLKEQRREGVANFDAAKASFDRGNYLDAIPDFKAFIEQFPGTDRTDDALYYLGESYIHEKDYALASAQFDRLLRDFPTSPFQADALFELARCDDLQSRPAPLDQTETERALTRYNQFADQYPSHARITEARARIQALRDRLAEKRLRTARLYFKLRQDAAAAIYLRRLLSDYPDSKWTAEASLLLAKVLARQGKKVEAVQTLKKLIASGPDGELRRKADEALRSLQASEAPR